MSCPAKPSDVPSVTAQKSKNLVCQNPESGALNWSQRNGITKCTLSILQFPSPLHPSTSWASMTRQALDQVPRKQKWLCSLPLDGQETSLTSMADTRKKVCSETVGLRRGRLGGRVGERPLSNKHDFSGGRHTAPAPCTCASASVHASSTPSAAQLTSPEGDVNSFRQR